MLRRERRNGLPRTGAARQDPPQPAPKTARESNFVGIGFWNAAATLKRSARPVRQETFVSTPCGLPARSLFSRSNVSRSFMHFGTDQRFQNVDPKIPAQRIGAVQKRVSVTYTQVAKDRRNLP
jgi:hypothetical protein